MKKRIFGLFTFGTFALTQAFGASVELTGTVKAGSTELKPGKYELEVKGGTATFTWGRIEVANAPATVELGDQVYRTTSVETRGSKIVSIRLAGSTVRVILDQELAQADAEALASPAPAPASTRTPVATKVAAPAEEPVAVAKTAGAVELTGTVWAGSTELKAGPYKMQVKDGVAIFRSGPREAARVPVTVELGKREYTETSVETNDSRIVSIRMGGSTTRVVLEQAGAVARSLPAPVKNDEVASTTPARTATTGVDVTSALWAGDIQLKPGHYKVEVRDGVAIFKSGPTEVAQISARTESGALKYVNTLVESSESKMVAIRVGGSTTRIVLRPTSLALAGGGN